MEISILFISLDNLIVFLAENDEIDNEKFSYY